MAQTEEPPISDALRALAHDLANVLTVMHGCLELADRHGAANPPLAKLLSNMRQAADRADTVAERLRELAGRGA